MTVAVHLQVDTESDDKALQAQLSAIKTTGVKTIISIGGWFPQALMCLLDKALSTSSLPWPAPMPAGQPSFNQPLAMPRSGALMGSTLIGSKTQLHCVR